MNCPICNDAGWVKVQGEWEHCPNGCHQKIYEAHFGKRVKPKFELLTPMGMSQDTGRRNSMSRSSDDGILDYT
jgi:hypothetical protein